MEVEIHARPIPKGKFGDEDLISKSSVSRQSFTNVIVLAPQKKTAVKTCMRLTLPRESKL